jgi:TRAP transporter TAXI family solute receptor
MPRVPAVPRRTVLAAAGALALGACTRDPGYPAGPLRIASGGNGGVYFAYAQGIAKVVRTVLPRLRPAVLETAASVENLEMLASGNAELGFTTADAAADAYHGTTPFRAPVPVAALGRVYENYLHLVMRLDLGVTRLPQLRGHRISIGPLGSATELLARRLLPMVGLNPDRDVVPVGLDPDAAADAVAARQLDGMFFCGGIPTAAIADLARRIPIQLVPLADYVPELRIRYNEVYVERSIPASAYGLGKPTPTVGVANYLVVLESMDERVAYRVIKALFERRDLLAAAHPAGSRLDRGAAISTPPLPLHPGAVRYYREAKQ